MCKLWFWANDFPEMAQLDTTDAFYNRMNLLLFNHIVTEEEKDEELGEKLWAERDLIFSLAVEAFGDLVNRRYKFTQPEDSLVYLQEYKKDVDSFLTFMNEMMILSPECKGISLTL